MAVWQSNVLWPAGVCSTAYGDNISTDTHMTRDAAMKVCRALHMDGFGGEGKVFPIVSWVSEPQTGSPRLPLSVKLLVTMWKEHNLLEYVGRAGKNMFHEIDWWVDDTIGEPEVQDLTRASIERDNKDYIVAAGLPPFDLLSYFTTGRWPQTITTSLDYKVPRRSFFGVFLSFLSDLRVGQVTGSVTPTNVMRSCQTTAIQTKDVGVLEENVQRLVAASAALGESLGQPAWTAAPVDDAEAALEQAAIQVEVLKSRAAEADARSALWEWAATHHKEHFQKILNDKPPEEWSDALLMLKEVVTQQPPTIPSTSARMQDVRTALRKVVAEVNQRDFSCMSQRCKIVPGVSCCKDSLTEAIAQAEALLNK